MKTITTIADMPNVPAVYAMYGGRGRSLHVAYVGIAERLRQRIEQHLVKHDSSVTTGASVVSLNPDLVTEVHWWEHDSFADRAYREAAELVAFDILEPALRSRGGITDRAKQLYAEASFQEQMRYLFTGDPFGRLVILTLQDALERIEALERRVAALERLLAKSE